jgi:hypothetical protein
MNDYWKYRFLFDWSGRGVLTGDVVWCLCRIGVLSFRDLGVCDVIKLCFSVISTRIFGWVGVIDEFKLVAILCWVNSDCCETGGLFVIDGCLIIWGEGERGWIIGIISSFFSISFIGICSCSSIEKDTSLWTDGGGVGTRFFSFK